MSLNYIETLKTAKAGNWDEAHQQVQASSSRMACLIHAYLHRVEGDLSNANYWYARAGSMMPYNSVEDEYKRLYALAEETK